MTRTLGKMLCAAAVLAWLAGAGSAEKQARPAMPPITKPVMFDTPEADEILAALQVFPPDNPWNQDVSKWPVHPNSRNIIASIGADKPLRHNSDMGFILVPPNQKRVPVKIVAYPGESDKGPFPVPDNLPIEGWPVELPGQERHARRRAARQAPRRRRPPRDRRRSGPTACSTSSTRRSRPTPAGRRRRRRSSI